MMDGVWMGCYQKTWGEIWGNLEACRSGAEKEFGMVSKVGRSKY
jgi:hypothetical protein